MRVVVWLTLLGLGCSGDEAPTDSVVPELSGCDDTDPAMCALPYPSSYFQVADDTTASGVQNAYSETALPIDRDFNLP